jgi:flagellar biosynthesis component FlhA
MIKENTNSSGKLTEKMTKPEFETMKELVSTLPINRQVFVFIGLVLVISALLGDFGHVLVAVIGMTMIFSAMLKLQLFEKCLKKCPWNSRK